MTSPFIASKTLLCPCILHHLPGFPLNDLLLCVLMIIVTEGICNLIQEKHVLIHETWILNTHKQVSMYYIIPTIISMWSMHEIKSNNGTIKEEGSRQGSYKKTTRSPCSALCFIPILALFGL